MAKEIEVRDEEVIKWFMEQYGEDVALEVLGKEPARRIVFFTPTGIRVFTPKQLLDEMQKGTEVGRLNMEIIREWLKYKREKEIEGK